MRRSPIRRKSRPVSDRVTPELHRYILQRDCQCVLHLFDPLHQCFDRWGEWNWPFDLEALTVDHVWREGEGAHAGKRAPSDRWHLVAMCWAGNAKPPSHDEREAERRYLLDKEGPAPVASLPANGVAYLSRQITGAAGMRPKCLTTSARPHLVRKDRPR